MGEEMASSLGLSYAAIAAIGFNTGCHYSFDHSNYGWCYSFCRARGPQFSRTEIRRKLS